MKTITFEKSLNLKNVVYVDVRSEKEFEDGTIHGAINIPVFNNEERALVGTMYKQVGKNDAKEKGLEIASAKLSDFYKRYQEIQRQYGHIIIFCARGGMRSKSIATVMDLMQLNVYQLEGGYKLYRQHVLSSFEAWREKGILQFLPLHGNTGSGKTDLLDVMDEKDFPVLNLERLANHRGSVFGDIGLGQQPSQKTFEANLYEKILELKDGPIFVEAENTKIGKRTVPHFVMEGIREGIHIMVSCDTSERVKRLMKEYCQTDHDDQHTDILRALNHIKQFMSNATYTEIKDAVEKDDLALAAEKLLIDYYDPRYVQWKKKYKNFKYKVDTTDLDQALMQIKAVYKDFVPIVEDDVAESEAALTAED